MGVSCVNLLVFSNQKPVAPTQPSAPHWSLCGRRRRGERSSRGRARAVPSAQSAGAQELAGAQAEGGPEDQSFGSGHRRRVVWILPGVPKAFVRGPGENETLEVPDGVHDFQAEPQRPVLQHPVLRLLPCPHRDDHPGDLVHGKGRRAGPLHPASAQARQVGRGTGGRGAGTWKLGAATFRGALTVSGGQGLGETGLLGILGGTGTGFQVREVLRPLTPPPLHPPPRQRNNYCRPWNAAGSEVVVLSEWKEKSSCKPSPAPPPPHSPCLLEFLLRPLVM